MTAPYVSIEDIKNLPHNDIVLDSYENISLIMRHEYKFIQYIEKYDSDGFEVMNYRLNSTVEFIVKVDDVELYPYTNIKIAMEKYNSINML